MATEKKGCNLEKTSDIISIDLDSINVDWHSLGSVLPPL